ncbi:hypothetical protein JIN85_20905, partial [Luteolibacter pohnpeiensis]
HSFVEETVDALLNQEHKLVELGAAAGSVKLATSAANAVGVLTEKQPGNPHVTVRLLGKGGTVKMVASAIINKGERLTWAAGGNVAPAATGFLLGRKLTQGASAAGDVIEVLDNPINIPA